MAATTVSAIGPWSEIKLRILKEYASAYSRILAAQHGLTHVYIDAFAGAGMHLSRSSGDFVLGSPLNALLVEPHFAAYHLIDIDGGKAKMLREKVGERPDVMIYEGDCNAILLDKVFPQARYEDYRRALCLLDPYGLHLRWEVIQRAGEMGSIDMFLNFPLLDMNRNVLRRVPENVDPVQSARLDAFWGDHSWYEAAYAKGMNLFGWDEKTGNAAFAAAFRKRLKDVAGFANVPEPIVMKNSTGAELYYLFFASQKSVAANIVKDIFAKYSGMKVA